MTGTLIAFSRGMKPSCKFEYQGWVISLDKAPFDETFHDLENIEEGALLSESKRRVIFWYA